MPGIDYSKWDNLSVSDSDGSESDEGIYDGGTPSQFANTSSPLRPSPHSDADAGPAERSLIQRGISYQKDAKDGWLVLANNIRIHPEDKKMSTLSDVLLKEDPNTYLPDKRKYTDGRVRKWGLEPPKPPSESSDDGIFQMMQGLALGSSNQFLYKSFDTGRGESVNNKDDPEEQFINALIERKIKYCESEAVRSSMKHTFVLRIELVRCEKDVWRRVRVPSAIDLSKLHDQVIVPAMGWSRGYHNYAFEDPNDGATIGPTKYSGGIDSMHVPMLFIKIMDDRGIPLAALMNKKGDTAYYIYDFGDQWEHRIVLEDIIKEEESVTLVDGCGACPPEDSNGLERGGSHSYQDFLDEYKIRPNSSKMKKAVKEASKSINYAKPWGGGSPIQFNPLKFDIEYHRWLMGLMIAGPSVKKKRGIVHTNRDGAYHESMKGCEGCGSRLKALSKCMGCKKVSYCGRDCQLKDWPNHKAACKKEQKKAKKRG